MCVYVCVCVCVYIETFYKLLEMHMFRKNSDSTKRCKTKIKTIHSPFPLPQIMSVEICFFLQINTFLSI